MKVVNDNAGLFKFKQFSMLNDVGGLKIGTDGVLLGAWVDLSQASEVWDIGSGTGLISLMMSQRCNAEITGFEIDGFAAEISRRNFEMSDWCERLALVEGDVMEQSIECATPDLIVSNPPYFSADRGLSAKNGARDVARRAGSLSFDSLIRLAAERLAENGSLAMISPYSEEDAIEWLCAMNRFQVRRKTVVVSKYGKAPFRILWQVYKESGVDECVRDTLILRGENGTFTEQYRSLTGQYYLDN